MLPLSQYETKVYKELHPDGKPNLLPSFPATPEEAAILKELMPQQLPELWLPPTAEKSKEELPRDYVTDDGISVRHIEAANGGHYMMMSQMMEVRIKGEVPRDTWKHPEDLDDDMFERD